MDENRITADSIHGWTGRESEGTELKRPALLWFAVHILVLPVSTTGNKQPYRLHVYIFVDPLFFVPVPVSRIEPDMASCMRISSSIPCYTNAHALIIPGGYKTVLYFYRSAW